MRMTFTAGTYVNFVAQQSTPQERLFLQYLGPRNDFDIIVVGSGIGGGILADNLAERAGNAQRILVLEAGSYLYPTHVYNICRFPNFELARHFSCDTFWQTGNDGSEFFIGERPQLGLGGRSIFWSGLIPAIQDWELAFFPDPVRQALTAGSLLERAGATMNESRSMGAVAHAVVARLRQSPLAADFSIHETPRALHQPYLRPDGQPADEFFTEPTGVFNTAELLVNQLGLTPGVKHGDGPGLHLLLQQYVEDVQRHGQQFHVIARNTLTGSARTFTSPTVVLAAGSIESPKLVRRSSLFGSLPLPSQGLVGRGLTDHPTTSEIVTYATHIGDVAISKSAHAKIIFYSRGQRDAFNRIRYPFNVEMNVNHEYWHLRENDPDDPARTDPTAFSANDPLGPSRIDIKFSFANCLDDDNEIRPAPPFEYVPEIRFHNQKWMDHLRDSRFPAVAGWQKSYNEIFAVLNQVTYEIFSQFRNGAVMSRPENEVWYGQGGKGFGYGTVHHAAGSLRMPARASYTSPFAPASVVDENLQMVGVDNLYVCDMSVMPLSTAANPVRTLAALALRLGTRLTP
jgi:hypothetical protein